MTITNLSSNNTSEAIRRYRNNFDAAFGTPCDVEPGMPPEEFSLCGIRVLTDPTMKKTEIRLINLKDINNDTNTQQ